MKYYAINIDKDGKEHDLSEFIDENDWLDVPNKNLTGTLKSNVKNIHCYNNELTSLDVPNVEILFCCNNQLTSFYLPNAKKVECYNNQLTSLNLPNAKYVYCYDNRLTSLNLPNAIEVNCANNQLTSLDVPNAETVCAKNNPLKALVKYCGKNRRQIWSQKIGDTIYTYTDSGRFTLKRAIKEIYKKYKPKEAREYIYKVIESQEAVES